MHVCWTLHIEALCVYFLWTLLQHALVALILCPICTVSTLMLTEAVAVVFVAQNSVTSLYENLSGANTLT